MLIIIKGLGFWLTNHHGVGRSIIGTTTIDIVYITISRSKSRKLADLQLKNQKTKGLGVWSTNHQGVMRSAPFLK